MIMGEIMTVRTSSIKPSQDFVKEGTIRYILDCFINNEFTKLPPIPIVRNNPDEDGYIAIDGHNLIVVNNLLGIDSKVYLASSELDGLEENGMNIEAIKQRNLDLLEKYSKVLENIKSLQTDGIKSFQDLRNKYEYLASLQIAKEYFGL